MPPRRRRTALRPPSPPPPPASSTSSSPSCSPSPSTTGLGAGVDAYDDADVSPPDEMDDSLLSSLASGRAATLLFIVLLSVRVSGALLSPIGDCDETFNYWEPMHYVLYGYGLQTWEYSPEFALRSYAYLYPYALVTKVISLLPLRATSPKVVQFYGVRIVHAVISAIAEFFLLHAVKPYILTSTYFTLFAMTAFSPGLFRAATEFLPSSFAMVCVTIAHALWLRRGYALAVLAIALASLLGWVFAAVLGVPLAIYIALSLDRLSRGMTSKQVMNCVRGGTFSLIRMAALSGVPIIAVMMLVDSWYFGRITCAPLNHVLYNVFPKPGTGSHLYGIEPASFYVVNLVLNHPVAGLLFFLYPVIAILHRIVSRLRPPTFMQFAYGPGLAPRQLNLRFMYVSAAYVAFAVFVVQPHKEERFLTPMYPLIVLAAGFALDDMVHMTNMFIPQPTSPLRRLFASTLTGGAIVAAVCLGASRTAMQVQGFGAPLDVYGELSDVLTTQYATASPDEEKEEVNVCVGAEWYRFPGNMFMPQRYHRIRFVAHGFDGALPMPFTDAGTHGAAQGLNEYNQVVPEQFFIGRCHLSVCLSQNCDFVRDADEDRKSIISRPFMDKERSRKGARAFYVPFLTTKMLEWDYYVVVQHQTAEAEDEEHKVT